MNPILMQTTIQTMLPQLRQMKQTMETIKNANNPQSMLIQMSQQTPIMKQVIDIGNKYGGNYDLAVKEIATQNGIDIRSIMNMI